jgi:hypothetical protein
MIAALLPLIPLLVPLIPKIADLFDGDDREDVAQQVATVITDVAGSVDPTVVAAALSDPTRAGTLATEIAIIAANRARVEEEARTARMLAELKDVADARASTVALAAAGSSIAWAAPVMSIVITAGFFAVVAAVMMVERVWDERTATLLNALLGAMTISFGQVCNYWLGSSRGSAAKDERAAAVAAAPAVRSILRR